MVSSLKRLILCYRVVELIGLYIDVVDQTHYSLLSGGWTHPSIYICIHIVGQTHCTLFSGGWTLPSIYNIYTCRRSNALHFILRRLISPVPVVDQSLYTFLCGSLNSFVYIFIHVVGQTHYTLFSGGWSLPSIYIFIHVVDQTYYTLLCGRLNSSVYISFGEWTYHT